MLQHAQRVRASTTSNTGQQKLSLFLSFLQVTSSSVVYSTDSGSTWLGLTFQGTPGGTGCPGNGNTADAAKAWLLTQYINKGYCCATGGPNKGPVPISSF
jgi:hypothetical protein